MWYQHSSGEPNLFDSTPSTSGTSVWLFDPKKDQGVAVPLPGESWIVDISEWPSGADAFSRVLLSEILVEVGPDERYWLSPKACKGILTRSERRGKQLPELLAAALRRRADSA
jgi:hypothetical protein